MTAGCARQGTNRCVTRWKEKDERVSIEQYYQELEEANREIDQDNYLSHEEAVKAIRSWREK